MKHKSVQIINQIGDHLIDQFYVYADKYNIDSDIVSLTVYPYNYPYINNSNRCNNGNAITVYDFYHNRNNIVEKVGGTIYIPTERILMHLIDANMDIELCINYYDMILLHEIGHIVYGSTMFIGKTIDECNGYLDQSSEDEKRITKLRKNASIKSRKKYFIEYFNLPAEKGANDAVGITIEQIVDFEMKML